MASRSIGSLLRAHRRRADLTRYELARRSDVPPFTIAAIEYGHSANPRILTIAKLAKALAVPLEAFVPETAVPQPGK